MNKHSERHSPSGISMAAVVYQKHKTAQRIPSLDGLRAIAITMVIVSHLEQSKQAPIHHFSSLGYFGVRIFFVISGLLITQLLLKEKEQTGRISLSGFYFRRTLRLLPAMWFYLCVLAALSLAGVIILKPYDLWSAFSYTVNYHQQRSWLVGHLWSVSVEEQFYLMWPLAVAFLDNLTAKRLAIATLVASPILRAIIIVFNPEARIAEWFPTICDTLATGCVMALIAASTKDRLLSACNKPWFIVVPALALGLNTLQYHVNPSYYILFASVGQTVMNCCIALTIGWLVKYHETPAGKLLNSRPLLWVGTISYSLYIWQQAFLNHEISNWLTSFPTNIFCAGLAAVASYYAIEQPVLRLRNRWRPVRVHRPMTSAQSGL